MFFVFFLSKGTGIFRTENMSLHFHLCIFPITGPADLDVVEILHLVSKEVGSLEIVLKFLRVLALFASET